MSAHGGKREGAGRKPKTDEQLFLRLIDRAWPRERKLAALKKHAQLAEEGNVKSMALLLAYRYGKPTERHEHSNPDGTPLMKPVADALVKIYGNAK